VQFLGHFPIRPPVKVPGGYGVIIRVPFNAGQRLLHGFDLLPIRGHTRLQVVHHGLEHLLRVGAKAAGGKAHDAVALSLHGSALLHFSQPGFVLLGLLQQMGEGVQAALGLLVYALGVIGLGYARRGHGALHRLVDHRGNLGGNRIGRHGGRLLSAEYH